MIKLIDIWCDLLAIPLVVNQELLETFQMNDKDVLPLATPVYSTLGDTRFSFKYFKTPLILLLSALVIAYS